MKQTYINFKDCYADIAEDMKTYPHELNYSPRYQINMTYEQMENSINSRSSHAYSIDIIHNFLDKALPEAEEQQQFLESIGLLLTPDPTYYEPLYVFGSDTQGMRLLFSLIGSMIGLNNVSTLTMAELDSDHTNMRQYYFNDKLLNIALWDDSKYDDITIPNMATNARRAAEHHYNLLPYQYTKLLFIAHEMPKTVLKTAEGYSLFNYIHLEDLTMLRDPKLLQEFIKALPCLFYLATNEARCIYSIEREAAYEEAEAKQWNSVKLPDGNTLELII